MRTIRYGEQRKARFVESSQLIHLNSFGCPKSFMFVVRRFRLRALEPAVKCRLVDQRPSSLATRAKGGVVVRYLSSSPPESETPLSGEIDDSVGDNEESGEALSKKDLAKILSQQHGITASMANNILTTVFGTMTEYVADGKGVRIVRFGTLELQPCKARMARNPKTNATVQVPGMDRIRFRPSDFFKGLLNRPKPSSSSS